MGTIAPSGYLICDGTTYNIEDYPMLANHFETNFGTVNHFGGDGTTTFKVPDLRGEFLRGTGTNSHTNQGSGGDVGVHQDGTGANYIGVGSNGLFAENVDTGLSNYDSLLHDGTSYNNFAKTSTASGGGTWSGCIYTARPTNTSVAYLIKT